MFLSPARPRRPEWVIATDHSTHRSRPRHQVARRRARSGERVVATVKFVDELCQRRGGERGCPGSNVLGKEVFQRARRSRSIPARSARTSVVARAALEVIWPAASLCRFELIVGQHPGLVELSDSLQINHAVTLCACRYGWSDPAGRCEVVLQLSVVLGLRHPVARECKGHPGLARSIEEERLWTSEPVMREALPSTCRSLSARTPSFGSPASSSTALTNPIVVPRVEGVAPRSGVPARTRAHVAPPHSLANA